MNSQDINPIAYHGKWKVPQYGNDFQINGYREFMGTLFYYRDKVSILELYVHPPITRTTIHCHCDTIFGEDVYGKRFSLFSPHLITHSDMRKFSFQVDFFIMSQGTEPVKALNEMAYHYCYVDYPFLRDWAFKNVFITSHPNGSFNWDANKGLNFKVEIEPGIELLLSSPTVSKISTYTFSVEQTTRLTLISKEHESIGKFLELISEFSQFLSIATFCKQSPSSISFRRENEDQPWWQENLYYIVNDSTKPTGSIIKYDNILVHRPDILFRWHENYQQMSPIIKYLIQSVTEDKKEFDAPDFLIIAEALDGYFKRFVNNKDGKDTRQYENQITKLLKRFDRVELLNLCAIDAKVLAHSRHKYSHLIPDNETRKIEKAVAGEELFYLTKKSIVLLTCCVLDYLGLDNEEINVCFRDSVIEDMVNNIPSWYRKSNSTIII